MAPGLTSPEFKDASDSAVEGTEWRFRRCHQNAADLGFQGSTETFKVDSGPFLAQAIDGPSLAHAKAARRDCGAGYGGKFRGGWRSIDANLYIMVFPILSLAQEVDFSEARGADRDESHRILGFHEGSQFVAKALGIGGRKVAPEYGELEAAAVPFHQLRDLAQPLIVADVITNNCPGFVHGRWISAETGSGKEARVAGPFLFKQAHFQLDGAGIGERILKHRMFPSVLQTALEQGNGLFAPFIGHPYLAWGDGEIFGGELGSVESTQSNCIHQRQPEELHDIEYKRLGSRARGMEVAEGRLQSGDENSLQDLPVKHAVAEGKQGVEWVLRGSAGATVRPKLEGHLIVEQDR